MTSKQKLKKAIELIEQILEEGDLDFEDGLEEALELLEDVKDSN